MNIIQSYYQIDNNTCYNNKTNKNNDNYLINYYSMLLSFITLKKLYGEVSIYCNDLAYDEMIKYIPYDNIIKEKNTLINTNNYQKEWGLLKFNVFEKQKKPFIHIDCDVFMFDDLLANYMYNEYDAIVQSIDINNIYNYFYNKNKKKLDELGFINLQLSEDSYRKYKSALGYNNGVVGFKNMSMMDSYIRNGKKMNELMTNGVFKHIKHQTMIFEQFNLYHFSLMNNNKVYTVLPTNEYIQLGPNEVGNKYKYTHLLSGNKYVDKFIMLVREKIINNYIEYIEHLFAFERSISNKNIKLNTHKNINKYIR